MTDKVTLSNIASFQNDSTAVAQYTSNNAAITAAMDNTLSLNGQAPNQLQASIDMNSNHILNLPAPSSVNEPARLIDVVTNPTIVIPNPPNTTVQTFFSGSGTYTTPPAAKRIWVRMIGGGGGGAGSGTSPGAATSGAPTTFGTSFLSAGGGTLGVAGGTGSAASGGVASGGDLNINGGSGSGTAATTNSSGGSGGAAPVFGVSTLIAINSVIGGLNAVASSGSGGAGASCSATVSAGGGGAGGAYVEKLISSPNATYSYSVGAAGVGGTAGTSGATGGNGAAGFIIVFEYYI